MIETGAKGTPPSGVCAMVLAAGLGTRLLPVTRVIPKALLPVGGRALLEWNLRFLAESGIETAVVNAHHLGLMIVRWVEERRGVAGLPREMRAILEPRILGTAGGIGNAAPHLDSETVVIANADQIFRPDLAEAIALHRSQKFLGTLLCVRDPEHRQIRPDGARVREILTRPDRNDPGLVSFTGVYLLCREAIERMPRGSFGEMTPLLREWAAERRLGCRIVEGTPFQAVGDAEAYLETALAMRAGGPTGAILPPRVTAAREPLVSPDAVILPGATIEESVVLPGAVIDSGARVTRSIIGPGDPIRGECDRQIVAAGESRRIALLPRSDEEMIRSLFAPPARSVRLLAGDGSTRRFARAFLADGTRVVLQASPPDPRVDAIYPRRSGFGAPDENDSYVYVASYLEGLGVPVPRVTAVDRERGILVLEDLGDSTLFDRLRRSDVTAGERLRWLEEALRILTRMQGPARPAFDMSRVAAVPYDAPFILRYEGGYFHRELVQGFAGIQVPFEDLEPDLTRAAREALDGAPSVFMHRDFQSRNLMLSPRGLGVIDLQGARLGPPEYDLASLLLDPYIALERSSRESLLERYLDLRRIRGTEARAEVRRRFRFSGVNRLMQALGAFAYLGGRLGRAGFLEHIPVALAMLHDLAAADLPLLVRSVERVEARLGSPSGSVDSAENP